MEKEFKKFIAKEKLFKPDERILLAVSGGVDSTLMAWLFHKAGFLFGIAHCNFGLREMDSDSDEYFVREFAAKLEVPFYSHHFDTLNYATKNRISIQMAARELRYAFFNELVIQRGYNYIATAHHKDDVIETFFINLFRGTGIAGLHGISPKKGKLIRPLLFANRQEIETLAAKEKIVYRNDASNNEDKYLRNQIRHSLIPALEKIDACFPQTMHGNINRLEMTEKIYREKIHETEKKIISKKNDLITIPINKLLELDPLPAYLYEFISPYGFNDDVVNNIIKALKSTPGKLFYSPTHRLLIDRENLLISVLSGQDAKNNIAILINQKDKLITHPVKIKITRTLINKNFVVDENPNVACLNAEKLIFPLTIRKWKHGDIFHPLGARGKKKLSDYFSDHKFSRFDKEKCWLLCSNDTIVWLIGYRISHLVRITAKTKNAFTLTLSED